MHLKGHYMLSVTNVIDFNTDWQPIAGFFFLFYLTLRQHIPQHHKQNRRNKCLGG